MKELGALGQSPLLPFYFQTKSTVLITTGGQVTYTMQKLQTLGQHHQQNKRSHDVLLSGHSDRG